MTSQEIAAEINRRLPELVRDGSENRIQTIAGIIDVMMAETRTESYTSGFLDENLRMKNDQA